MLDFIQSDRATTVRADPSALAKMVRAETCPIAPTKLVRTQVHPYPSDQSALAQMVRAWAYR